MASGQASREKNPIQAHSVLRVALYSLLFNLALVAAKLTLSLLSGSLALRADAIHSTVDVMASLALILGVKISERKSESFPLGLYKVENLASIAISFLCCFLPLMRSSWRRCEGMLCPSIIRDGCSMPWQR